jgi:hypothetical protein
MVFVGERLFWTRLVGADNDYELASNLVDGSDFVAPVVPDLSTSTLLAPGVGELFWTLDSVDVLRVDTETFATSVIPISGNWVTGMAADADALYLSVEPAKTVSRLPFNGDPKVQLSDGAFGSIVQSEQDLFVANGSSQAGVVFHIDKVSPGETSLASNQFLLSDLSYGNGRVFWYTKSYDGVQYVNVDRPGSATQIPGTGDYIKAVAADESHVYWIDSGALYRLDPEGL